MNRDSSVGKVIAYGLDHTGIRFPAGTMNSSLRHRFQADSRTRPTGTWSSFPGKNYPERKVPSSAEAKNAWISRPCPPPHHMSSYNVVCVHEQLYLYHLYECQGNFSEFKAQPLKIFHVWSECCMTQSAVNLNRVCAHSAIRCLRIMVLNLFLCIYR